MSELSFTTTGIDNILQALKSKAAVKVGVVSAGREDSKSGMTNDVLGMFHEFGTSKMPKRSFLREPLMDNIEKKLKEANLLDEETLKKVVKTKEPNEILNKMGVLAVGIVQEGFTNGGYGKWAPHAKGYTNKTGDILVDTQQLRNSITYEVSE